MIFFILVKQKEEFSNYSNYNFIISRRIKLKLFLQHL